MDGKDVLHGVNKNDNKSRVMFSVICLLVVLIACLLIYMFVFKASGEGDDNTSSQTETSQTASQPDGDNSGENSDISDISETGESSGDISNDVSGNVSQDVSDISETSADTSGEEITDHGWVINYLGYTYLYYGIGLEQFTYTSNVLNKYVSAVNNLSSVAGDSNFYHILIPTRCEFVDIPKEIRKSDDFYVGNQNKFITDVFAATDQSVKNVDVYNLFKENYQNNEYLYFNTDPNYTHKGAYIAYKEYCRAAGIEPVSDSLYTEKILEENFYGKFFTATGSTMLYENFDVFFYYDIDEMYLSSLNIYKGGIVKKDGVIYFDVPSYGYYCFLSDEAAKMEITTKVKTGKSVLVIGDSSAAPFATFLVPHYDKITYINTNHAKDSILDLLTSGQYDDIVVINYNTTASRTVHATLNTLAGIAN